MGKSLKVKVNKTFEFDCSLEEVSKLDISVISDEEYHLLYDNVSYQIKVVSSNFHDKTYQISIDNSVFEVDLYNDLDLLIKEMGFSVSSKKEVKSISAPMPGLILDIPVNVGQEVQENDTLVILEAMKMENSILSPINGIVKTINAVKGDAVEKNHVIIEFE